MRLAPILIMEGRKEDLRKKYTEKFKEYPENLEFILGISDLEDKNFKYSDFVLKNTHPNASTEEVEDIVSLVKDFDRFQQSLEVKDINKYDLDGLQRTIDLHKTSSKSQQKKSIDTSEAKKIYEDSNILIIRPLTYQASCKYGAGTKWCTTMADESSYFESHTSGDQALYYIILKNFNIDNKFYKIAIHLTPNTETWYDATDEKMSERERDVFNLGAPKVIETIRKDYSQKNAERERLFFKKLFDFDNYNFENITNEFKGSEHSIGIEFQKPDLVPDMPGHATMEMNISVDGENIDQYLVMITYDIGDRVTFNIGFTGDNFDIEPEFDFNIENLTVQTSFWKSFIKNARSMDIKDSFDEICWSISSKVVNKMKQNNEFMTSIRGGKSWEPNRRSYGYTFKRKDSGLIKKLVDYLESNKKGTKLDFLVDIGSLEKKDINGKPYYSLKDRKMWQIPSAYRGQLSGLFNSARLAGIIDYDKKGNQFYLKKGPNFEAFKSGELKTV